MVMISPGLLDPRLREVARETFRELATTVCIQPDEIRNYMLSLDGFFGGLGPELIRSFAELRRLSNVGSEQELGPFLSLAYRVFYNLLPRTRIASARSLVQQVLREFLGTAPAPVSMQRFACQDPGRILFSVRAIERNLMNIAQIFERMQMPFEADAQRLQDLIARSRGPAGPRGPLGIPRPRTPSATEQIIFATLEAVAREIEALRRSAQAVLQQIVPAMMMGM